MKVINGWMDRRMGVFYCSSRESLRENWIQGSLSFSGFKFLTHVCISCKLMHNEDMTVSSVPMSF